MSPVMPDPRKSAKIAIRNINSSLRNDFVLQHGLPGAVILNSRSRATSIILTHYATNSIVKSSQSKTSVHGQNASGRQSVKELYFGEKAKKINANSPVEWLYACFNGFFFLGAGGVRRAGSLRAGPGNKNPIELFSDLVYNITTVTF